MSLFFESIGKQFFPSHLLPPRTGQLQKHYHPENRGAPEKITTSSKTVMAHKNSQFIAGMHFALLSLREYWRSGRQIAPGTNRGQIQSGGFPNAMRDVETSGDTAWQFLLKEEQLTRLEPVRTGAVRCGFQNPCYSSWTPQDELDYPRNYTLGLEEALNANRSKMI